jgi:putative Ca2+/H+ antiporter (TMEM165/GDT1 family)
LAKKSIGFLLFLLCSIAIYYKVLHDVAWNQFIQTMLLQLKAIPVFDWMVLLVLFCLNFLLEAYKWKWVIYTISPISLLKAIESVFIGQAFAFFTPNRVGEFAGRTLFLPTADKLAGMTKMAWASYAQLLATIVMGCIALGLNVSFYPIIQGPWLVMVKWVSPLVGCIALLLFFYQRNWTGWLSFLNKVQVATNLKFHLLWLSLVRYLVFLLQYVWVARMLELNIGFLPLIFSVAILFLCISILPTISLTELVVRGQLLLLLLAPFSQDPLMIVAVSTFIWSVNFLAPAIIGAFLLLRYRLNQ